MKPKQNERQDLRDHWKDGCPKCEGKRIAHNSFDQIKGGLGSDSFACGDCGLRQEVNDLETRG